MLFHVALPEPQHQHAQQTRKFRRTDAVTAAAAAASAVVGSQSTAASQPMDVDEADSRQSPSGAVPPAQAAATHRVPSQSDVTGASAVTDALSATTVDPAIIRSMRPLCDLLMQFHHRTGSASPFAPAVRSDGHGGGSAADVKFAQCCGSSHEDLVTLLLPFARQAALIVSLLSPVFSDNFASASAFGTAPDAFTPAAESSVLSPTSTAALSMQSTADSAGLQAEARKLELNRLLQFLDLPPLDGLFASSSASPVHDIPSTDALNSSASVALAIVQRWLDRLGAHARPAASSTMQLSSTEVGPLSESKSPNWQRFGSLPWMDAYTPPELVSLPHSYEDLFQIAEVSRPAYGKQEAGTAVAAGMWL